MRLRQKTVQPRKKSEKSIDSRSIPEESIVSSEKSEAQNSPASSFSATQLQHLTNLFISVPASCQPRISWKLNVALPLQKCKITVCRPRISRKLNADTPRKPSTYIAQKPVCATPSPRHAAQKAPSLPALLRRSPMRRQSQRWDGYLS